MPCGRLGVKMENVTILHKQHTTISSECVPLAWLIRLETKFSAIFGARFTSTVASTDKRDAWIEVWRIGISGLTAEQIKLGLEKCTKTQEWPPSPAEFRALCLPVIDYEGMFARAANGDYQDRITYWAAQSFGAYDLRRMSYPAAKPRWIKIVDAMAAEHTLPNIPDQTQLRLPAPGQTIRSEAALAGIEAAKEALAKNPSRKWALEPKSQQAVNLMFGDPPMLEEIDIATKNGFISGKNWVPPEKRGR